MLNLCVTTFNRQDLLGSMLRSAFSGTVKPDRVFFVDQVRRPELIVALLPNISCSGIEIHDLGDKRGCEGSAINFYLEGVDEERIIAHEDVVFGPRSLEQFVATAGDFLIDDKMGVITYRDRCRELAGLYDLTISPNSFRYVDVDYEDRLALVGIHPTVVACGIQHLENGTMKGHAANGSIGEYHRLEEIARVNYEAKWGRPVTPGGNTIGRSQWRQR